MSSLRVRQRYARRAMLRCSSSRGGSPRRRRALPGTVGATLTSTSN
ncbi:MAG: hypothetical protein FWC38_00120 [Proteobacteria bacterium]|nr:hypothetical protein [Pseudomonadota bacterium]MCL2306648.1 hypothetical protein [Pseudomonadota bacterium]